MATTTSHGIGTRTVRGMFWAYGSYVGGRLLSLVATAILARLLLPTDFGLVALALSVMAFLDTFQGLSVAEALVIEDAAEVEEKAETALAVNVAVGLVLAVAASALGPVAARFFHQPKLVEVVPVLGLNFLVFGLGNTHAALALKSMDFRSRTIAELADVIVRGVISVVLALAGAGVWSLVIGYAVGTVAWTITIWHRVAWRPRFRPSRRHLRSLLSFGGAMTGIGVMAAFLTQFDNLVVGRVLGTTQLGFYSMATRLPYLFIVSLAVVAGRVLYPAFASLERGDMASAVLTSLRYTAMVVLPLTAFMAILARPLTIGLFGEQWQPAIAAAQVLCLWALTSTVIMVCGNAFKALGRADIGLKLAVPQAVALIIGSLMFVHQGIVAVAWVQAGISIAAQFAAIVVAQHIFGLTLRSVLGAIRPPVLASSGLAIVLVVIQHAISAPWPAIIASAGAGTVVYSGLLILLAPEMLRRLKTMAISPPARPEFELEMMQSPVDPLDETSPSGRWYAGIFNASRRSARRSVGSSRKRRRTGS